MARKSGYQTRFPPVLRHKRQFAYESSAPSAVRADSYGEHKSKLNHKVSDCFVACSARALSLIGPPSPRSIGTTHATIGLFRTLKCPHSTECRDGVENQQVCNPFESTMPERAHDAVTLAYLRGKPGTCPRRVWSRARRPPTVVFSLGSFYHREAEELSCTRM